MSINNTEKTLVYRYEVNPSELQIQYLFSTKELIGKTQKKRKLYKLKNTNFCHFMAIFDQF